MSITRPMVRVVLYEGTGSRSLVAHLRRELSRTLLERGLAVTRVLPGGHVRPSGSGLLLVLGRFEQPMPSDIVDGDLQVFFRNIEGLELEQVLAVVDTACAAAQLPERPKWKPWFPVIDYSRCTNCMQCLSFCLFDVYGVKNGKIHVQNQDNCKTDCPACSRVCPEVAIMFPKYRHGPINGDEVTAEDVRREKMKVDISALLGGDIYQLLRDRSAKARSRFAKERDEQRALEERLRCLRQLGKDIPPEVLASLPSPEEIQRKAEQAMKRAAEAQA